MFNEPGRPLFGFGGAGIEINYDNAALLRAALFLRRNAATNLQSIAVSEVESSITNFVTANFWIIAPPIIEHFLQNMTVKSPSDVAFAEVVPEDVKKAFAEAMANSSLFVEPKDLTLFPLVVVRVEAEFIADDFFLCPPTNLRPELLPGGWQVTDIEPDTFPPLKQWDGKRWTPAAWLGVWAGSIEVARRKRGAILGATALLPHRLERYTFSGRSLFGGQITVKDDRSSSLSIGDPHTPALMEDVIIGTSDRDWLAVLGAKIRSASKSDKKQMRSLEYYYRAWIPDSARRFPILFGALDAIYGDAGAATQSVIDAIGPVMGESYDYVRLKLLLSLRASVIHGGAPNVYESSAYHKYYEQYGEDAVRDLELITARCLQTVIFGAAMTERPHTHAALIKQETGRTI